MAFPFSDSEESEEEDNNKRVKNPTIATPTTYSLNWAYSENGPTDPKAVAGASTFMGVSKTAMAGKGKGRRDESVSQLQTAINLLRKEGYKCRIPPENHEFPSSTKKKNESEKNDPEYEYLRDNFFEEIIVEKDNETVIVLTTQMDWLYVHCTNEIVASVVEEKFAEHYVLGRVRHEERTVPIRDDLEVIVRTGNHEREINARPGTLFQLKKGNKVISKCLCSYSNGEMENSGPTIELFETAEEWRCHGYGSELFEVVEEHFENIFQNVADAKTVKFNVCYVTNRHACEWFLAQGFQDWDGAGEELGKYLCCE